MPEKLYASGQYRLESILIPAEDDVHHEDAAAMPRSE
jgi:hypothetical protein